MPLIQIHIHITTIIIGPRVYLTQVKSSIVTEKPHHQLQSTICFETPAYVEYSALNKWHNTCQQNKTFGKIFFPRP